MGDVNNLIDYVAEVPIRIRNQNLYCYYDHLSQLLTAAERISLGLESAVVLLQLLDRFRPGEPLALPFLGDVDSDRGDKFNSKRNNISMFNLKRSEVSG